MRHHNHGRTVLLSPYWTQRLTEVCFLPLSPSPRRTSPDVRRIRTEVLIDKLIIYAINRGVFTAYVTLFNVCSWLYCSVIPPVSCSVCSLLRCGLHCIVQCSVLISPLFCRTSHSLFDTSGCPSIKQWANVRPRYFHAVRCSLTRRPNSTVYVNSFLATSAAPNVSVPARILIS